MDRSELTRTVAEHSTAFAREAAANVLSADLVGTIT